MKIITRGGRIITRNGLFKKKEEFHKRQAKLPFAEKIKIVIKLQKIASGIKPTRKDESVWKI